ncbi:hypothetical protein BKP54_27435 [Ensifer sp. 1H6]|nr:hypothetical protein BKP54_27435 [Ensifer sp. 1H6]
MRGRNASRPRGPSNFAASGKIGSSARRLRRSRDASLDPFRPLMTDGVIFHKFKEMTMTIEQHIEELRAELQYCPDAEERHQIEAELEAARQELVRRNTDDPPPE